jgi:hypothetical protein
MQPYTETLTLAEQEFQQQGHFFAIKEATGPVTVLLRRGDGRTLQLPAIGAGKGMKLRADDAPFDAVIFKGGAGLTITWVVAEAEYFDQSVQVELAQADVLTLGAEVAVDTTAGGTVIYAASARRALYFEADDANTARVGFGPPGLTFDEAPVKLSPGDIWVESNAASAAWSAIAESGAQAVRRMSAA